LKGRFLSPVNYQPHGKLNYHGKPKKSAKASPAGKQRIDERKTYGRRAVHRQRGAADGIRVAG
jgi:hypothetical protein